MATEWGIFSDEGILEDEYYSEEKALAVLRRDYFDDPFAEVLEICPDHRDQPRHSCEECNAEEDEE